MKFFTWIIAIASAAAILLQDGACVCLPSTSNSPDRAITYQSNSTMVLFLLPCSSDCSVSTSMTLHEERLGVVVLDDYNNETNMNIQDKPWLVIHTIIYCFLALAMIVVRLYFFFTDTIAPVFFPYLYLIISILAAVSLINWAQAWRNQSTQPRFINTAAMEILRNWSSAMAILRYWSTTMTETCKLIQAWTRTTQDIARKRNWLAATTKQKRNRPIFRLVHIWSTKCLAGVKNQRLHAIVYLEEWTRQQLHMLKERKRHIQIQKQHDAASRIQRFAMSWLEFCWRRAMRSFTRFA